jgi:hypothetical protein
MTFLALLKSVYVEEPVADETLWHACRTPFIPKRTVDGGWTLGLGAVWRRKINGRWQYRQDEETSEQRDARQY